MGIADTFEEGSAGMQEGKMSSGTCMLCPDGRDGGSKENTAVVVEK
jgi:hypothetical protein